MRRKAVPTERSGHRMKPVLPEPRLLEQFVVRYLEFKSEDTFIFGIAAKPQLLRAIPKTERDEVRDFAHQPG